MTTEPETARSPLEYSANFTPEDKLDFIAFHLRSQSAVLAELRENQADMFSDLLERVNAIGQKVTNVDAFCAELRTAIDDMRNKPNPLMKMMGMGGLPPMPPPGKLIT